MRSLISLVLLFLGACDGVWAPFAESLPCGPAGGFCTPMDAQPPMQRSNIFGVWGSSRSDVWMVGDASPFQHWDGSRLSHDPNSTSPYLYGVWGSGPSDIWAGGGALWHYDGSSWSCPAPCAGEPTTNGIWGSRSDDIWAVGSESTAATILHYDGKSWSPQTVSNAPGLNAVFGLAQDDVWAVGYRGSILHYDGTAWSLTQVSCSNYYYGLSGIWASAPNDAWAVGIGALLHWDGTSWSCTNPSLDFSANLSDVWGSGPSDVWVVGSAGTIPKGNYGSASCPYNDAWGALSGSGLPSPTAARSATSAPVRS